MTQSTQTIPAGYKQTEIGVIPDDWSVKELHNIVTLNGLVRGPFGGSLKKEFFVPKGYRVFEQGDAIYGKGYIPRYFVGKEKFNEMNRFRIFPGNFILSCSGTIGRIFRIPNGYPDGIINQALLKIEVDEEKIDPIFFEAYFRWDNFQKKIIDNTQGGAMKNLIGMSDFRKSPILYPSKPEQIAIATVLTNTDALIEKLGKLIAKKRAIKQGTMRQLLNPFDAKGDLKTGWKLQSLFDLADSKKDLFDDGDWIEAEHITTKGVRLIQTRNIGVGKYLEKEEKKYIYEESFEKLKCKLLKQGDLLICRLADPAGRACVLSDIGDLRVITSVDVTIFRPRNIVANRYYLANLFSTDWWFQKVNESVGGTTHKRISKGALGKIIIALPSINDQNLSATVLSDMDAEIEKLENKLNKYHQIKTGMMQQLLTGKIRLIKN